MNELFRVLKRFPDVSPARELSLGDILLAVRCDSGSDFACFFFKVKGLYTDKTPLCTGPVTAHRIIYESRMVRGFSNRGWTRHEVSLLSFTRLLSLKLISDKSRRDLYIVKDVTGYDNFLEDYSNEFVC